MPNEQDPVGAAWYLVGLCVGLATDREPEWHKRTGGSWVATTTALETARLLTTKGGAFNPMHIWEMTEVARRLGFGRQQYAACEMVSGELKKEKKGI